MLDRYTDVLCRHISEAAKKLNKKADTLYFGGGTPSLLGGKRLSELISAAKSAFLTDDAEITIEANPAEHLYDDLLMLRAAGADRLTLGVQSGVESELGAISRRHTVSDAERTIKDAKAAGFRNISVDLMLGLPYQTMRSLEKSIEFALSLDVQHISCYILKLEPGTPLYKLQKSSPASLSLPDEDTVADMYLYMSEVLRQNGFLHYEISNFAKAGYSSRHNLKYWNDREYLGLGPAAHSYLDGKRFYFERDTEKYLSSPTPVSDGSGGDPAEAIMLRLRLSCGIDLPELRRLLGSVDTAKFLAKAERFSDAGLAVLDSAHFALTEKGFLVSNAVIGELLYFGE